MLRKMLRRAWRRGRLALLHDPGVEAIRANFIHFHPQFAHCDDVSFERASKSERLSTDLVARIVEAFRAYERKSPQRARTSGPSSYWDSIEASHHAELLDALRSGDHERVSDALLRSFSSHSTFGIDQWQGHQLLWDTDPNARYAAGLRCKDLLARLAESRGFLALENPEQPEWGALLATVSVDELSQTIERGLRIRVPIEGLSDGRFGLRTQSGLVSERDLFALHMACRITDILPDRDASICELGAGLGRCAIYALRSGYSRYTILDLPATNALQAAFLGANGFEQDIALFGESPSDRAVRILPPRPELIETLGAVDLVVNQDSMPEMSHDVATSYVTALLRARARLFLSLNHESGTFADESNRHVRVCDIMAGFEGVRRISRHPWWMRQGYVEEVFELRPGSSGL